MNIKKIGTLVGSLFLMSLLVGFFPAGANASTISVGDGSIAELGATTTVGITLDEAPDGLSGYIITVSLSDPTKAQITGVEFPSWATLTDQMVSGASVWMKTVDLGQAVEAGATDIDLGTLTIRGDAKGVCEINVAIDRADDDSGYPISPSASPGTLTVGQYDLTISSAAGGSVTDPGEGTFTYYAGEEVSLVASPDTDYEFAEWTGDIGTVDDINAASTTITMNGDYSVTGSFAVVVALAADADGPWPYSGTAGSPVSLFGSASGGTPPYSYAWDLDNDGAYDDSTLQNPTHTWTAAGTYTVGLQVTDDAGNTDTDTASVDIAAAPEPDILVSPTWKDFGNVPVDTSSSPQTFTVTNDGTTDLDVGTITITGIDARQFSKRNDNCSTETIAPGNSATLEVVFSPTSTGGKFAEISIPSDDPDEATAMVYLSGAGVVGPPSTVTLTADPINVVADGTSTSTLTATVKDAVGNNVADGTTVSFTTDRGILGSSTITKTTTGGVATATLTAPTERGIATVQAQANSVSDYTAVFFKEPGQADVVDSKTESTEPGTDTVDAKDEANTTVTKSGDGTPTITVAQYEENPGGPSITAFAGGYIEVYLDDTTDVNEVTICLYYPIGVDESEVKLYWWDEPTAAWLLTDPQTKNTTDVDGYGGKVCTTVSASGTVPTLDDLQGAVFAGVEEPD